MSRLRILLITHATLNPEELSVDARQAQTELDVYAALKSLRHDVQCLGLEDELAPLRRKLYEFKPDVVFVLLEEFNGEGVFDQNIVSYLEMQRICFTGGTPKHLMLCRDKALTKKILKYHRVPTPNFLVIKHSSNRVVPPKLNSMRFPLIIKSLTEESSVGISFRSVVHNVDQLTQQITRMKAKLDSDIIVEEFVAGREFYVSILGNQRLVTLPIWELKFGAEPSEYRRIATERIKWDESYQEKHKIKWERAKLDPELEERVKKMAQKAFRALDGSGYSRIDMRVDTDGRIHVLEVNPNPDLARDAEFAQSAEAAGLSYENLIEKLIQISLRRSRL